MLDTSPARAAGAGPAPAQSVEGVADLLRALRDPAAYPHPARDPRVVTTHISWVVLAGRYAYTVKRPVSLGVLDYSTLERRRHSCDEEVRLDRRLTRDLYLGVVPIVATATGVLVGGAGTPVEYAVRIRRLPERRMLSRLVTSGRANAEQLEELGELLARFHRTAEQAGPGDPGGAATVQHNTEENFRQLRPFVGTTISPERFRLLVTGLSGTGKSALAARLSAALGWPVVGSGRMRKELAGLPPESPQPAPYGAGLYGPERTALTYRALCDRAAAELRAGRSVVLDATFLVRAQRAAARRVAAEHGAGVRTIVCAAPEEVVAARLRGRGAEPGVISDAGWEVYREQAGRAEPPGRDEGPVYRADTARPAALVTRRAHCWLNEPATFP